MDKKELRQDPIREKILLFLTYIENNRNALYGIVGVVVVTILVGSYISTSSKELNTKSSKSFGKAINNSIAGNEETSISLFEDLINEGSKSTAGNSFVYLLDYYMLKENFEKVDSLLRLDIQVTDQVLQSKIYIIQGDMSLNRMDYSESIEFYSKASKENPAIKSKMMLKEAVVYYESGDFDKSKSIFNRLLDIENLQYELKNQCEKYLFMLGNDI